MKYYIYNNFIRSKKLCRCYYLLEPSVVQLGSKGLTHAAGKDVTDGRKNVSPLGATRLSQGQKYSSFDYEKSDHRGQGTRLEICNGSEDLPRSTSPRDREDEIASQTSKNVSWPSLGQGNLWSFHQVDGLLPSFLTLRAMAASSGARAPRGPTCVPLRNGFPKQTHRFVCLSVALLCGEWGLRSWSARASDL